MPQQVDSFKDFDEIEETVQNAIESQPEQSVPTIIEPAVVQPVEEPVVEAIDNEIIEEEPASSTPIQSGI